MLPVHLKVKQTNMIMTNLPLETIRIMIVLTARVDADADRIRMRQDPQRTKLSPGNQVEEDLELANRESQATKIFKL